MEKKFCLAVLEYWMEGRRGSRMERGKSGVNYMIQQSKILLKAQQNLKAYSNIAWKKILNGTKLGYLQPDILMCASLQQKQLEPIISLHVVQ